MASMFLATDTFWMQHAIQLAETAGKNQEVPVGAVLVSNDQILGEGSNRPISQRDPSAHAELIALRDGATKMGNYRLPDTTLYVTLEPCVMCLGAIVHARIKRVVFGAFDFKTGAVESVFTLGKSDKFNHQVEYCGGLLAEQCGQLLSDFFRAKRGS